jgi:Domain of unknown function (DUF397)
MTDKHPINVSWHKSSFSAQGNCLEAAYSSGSVLIRDSKDRRPYVLEFTSSEWRAFISGVRAGEFDLEYLGGSATTP